MILSKPCRLNLNLESHMSLCFFEYCAMYILGIILNKISNIYVVLKISREIIFTFETRTNIRTNQPIEPTFNF